MLMRSICLIAAVAGLGGCRFLTVVQGSGVSKTEMRSVGKYDQIELRGHADVDVTIGAGRTIKVTTDDNLLKKVETRVEGNRLIIETKGSWSSKLGVRIVVVNPELNSVSIAGSGDLSVSGVRETSFDASIAGSGDMKITGRTDKLNASIAGSGDMDLTGLRSTTAQASIAGSGDIKLDVTADLTASISGSGDISYSGYPRITKSINGSGEVHRR